MHTDLVDEKELISRARKICEDVDKIVKSGTVITQGGSHRDPVQTLVMRRGANKDYLITPIIEAAAIQAEIKAAGAGELFLRILSSGIRDDLSRRSIGIEKDEEWQQIMEKISSNSIPFRKKDLKILFGSSSQVYESIISSSFDLLRAEDSVSVRKSPSTKTQIDRESGYLFEGLSIDQRFLSRGTWDRKKVRVSLIDGIIEKVSEIHHFIEDASSKKQPCVIFCLDALPDVYETLVQNFQMRNLDVLIVKVPIDHTHVNTLADLGVIFGEHPIAASIGDSISTGLARQVCFADRVTVSKGKISIENKKNIRAVELHARELRDRIRKDINLSQVLEPRIQRLSSSTVRISVGIEDLKRDPNLVEKLDRTLRSLPKIIKSGFIEKIDFKEFSNNKIDLLFDVNYAISAEMAIQSIKTFLSTRDAIRSAEIGIRKI
jgi:hypothetical protein